VDPTGLAYFAGDGGAIWREGDNNDYKGKFDSFVDDPAPDSKNYSFFNYGSMNGAKDNTGIANNSTTGWKNDQNGESATNDIRYGIQGITNTLNTGVGLLQNGLNQELKTVAKGSAKAAEIAEGMADLANSTKIIGLAGKVLGITSAIQHGYKLGADYENGDWNGVAINTSKLILDGVFFFVKSTNPVLLGASVAYGVADYLTNEY